MSSVRVIPVLLLSASGMVKTVKFKLPKYIGEPVNAVKIFNEKQVDEIVVLDIDATRFGLEPNFKKIEEIASETFMPLGYGGGIQSLNHIERLFRIGVDKVIINSEIHKNPKFLLEASRIFGSQSIVACLDVKKDLFGRHLIYSRSGQKKESISLATFLSSIQENGAGELIVNSIDRDGTMMGYDLKLIKEVACKLNIPLVALGGAASVNDLREALAVGATSVAAGSMFVFHGRHKAVLISYVSPESLNSVINY